MGRANTVSDMVIVALAFALGYYTAVSGVSGDQAAVIKYRFIPRTASETLAMPDNTLREFSALLNVAPSSSTQ